jgi:hypothetical protein
LSVLVRPQGNVQLLSLPLPDHELV